MILLKDRILPALVFGASGAVSGASVGMIGYLFTKKKKNILIGAKYGAGIGAVLGFFPELWLWAMPEPFIPPTVGLVDSRLTATNIPTKYTQAQTLSSAQSFEDPYHADLIRID